MVETWGSLFIKKTSHEMILFVKNCVLSCYQTMTLECSFWSTIWYVYLLQRHRLLKKFKHEFSFISFEQKMRKILRIKVRVTKQFSVIMIHLILDILYYNAKWKWVGKDYGLFPWYQSYLCQEVGVLKSEASI